MYLFWTIIVGVVIILLCCGLWITFSKVEIRVNNVCPVIYCNSTNRIQICEINLRNHKDHFEYPAENNIEVLEPENGSMQCEIERINEQTLGVVCTALEVGRARIKLNIGERYKFIGDSEVSLTVHPSCPARLDIGKVDKKMSGLVGKTVEVELQSFDCLGNKACACKHEIKMNCEPEGSVALCGSEMRDGKYFVTLKCNYKCRAEVQVQLSLSGEKLDNWSIRDSVCQGINRTDNKPTASFLLDISYPPVSIERSTARIIPSPLVPKPQVKAGETITLEMDVRDQCGDAVHSQVDYEISATIGANSRVNPSYSQNKKVRNVVPTEAGQHQLKVLLDGQCLPVEGLYEKIEVRPSNPKNLSIVETKCSTPKDPKFKEDVDGLYCGDLSTVRAEIRDEYGNTATQVNKENTVLHVRVSDNQDCLGELNCKEIEYEDLEVRRGEIKVTFRLQQVGKHTLVVQCSNKKNPRQTVMQRIEINVLQSPSSTSLTKSKFIEKRTESTVTAGSECKFQLQVYDVFGNAFRGGCNCSAVSCDILPTCESNPGEYVRIEQDPTSQTVRFNVTVMLAVAGERQVEATLDDDGSIIIPIQVISSNPHHLNNLRFTTNSSSGPNILTLEADVSDKYGNVITDLDGNYEIHSKSFDDQGSKVPCQDPLISAGRIKINVGLTSIKKKPLSMTVLCKNTPDELELQNVELQVVKEDSETFTQEKESRGKESHTLIAGSQFKFHVFHSDHEAIAHHETANVPPTQRTLPAKNEPIHSNDASKQCCFIEVSVTLKTAGDTRLELFVEDENVRSARLEVKPDLDNVKCKHTTKRVTSVYTKQELVQAIDIVDRFGNNVPVDHSRPPRLLQKSGSKPGLKTNSTTKMPNNISYQFVKPGTYVVSLQCPDLHGDYTDVEEFSISVENAPVDPERSKVKWSPKFADMQDQKLFTDDKDFKCIVNLKDVLGMDFTGDPMFVDISIEYNGRKILLQKCQKFWNKKEGILEVTVPLDEFEITAATTAEFWFIFDGKKKEAPLRLTFTGFLKYDDDQCVVETVKSGDSRSTKTKTIVCGDVAEKDIRGDDNVHLHNITRICQRDDLGNIKVRQQESKTIVTLPQLLLGYEVKTCHMSLLHLTRALYYRREAWKADKEREKWRKRAMASYDEMKTAKKHGGENNRPTFCKGMKKKYAELMKEYNRNACEEIFKFHNMNRDQDQIDLHGLLVIDEEKLESYRKQLLDEGEDEEEVKRIIEKEKEEGDEAIKKIKERLNERKEHWPWLEIIVGAGHHSTGRQKIRPKVEKYLRENTHGFSVLNKGALVVTFKEYSGTGRCFGEYYCEKCEKSWKSSSSWKGYQQGCYRCYDTKKEVVWCLPLKQRRLERGIPKHKESAPIPHLQQLCQKCKELRSQCDDKR